MSCGVGILPFFLHLLFGALLAAVEFPGPPPGPAHASADGQDFRLSNNVIAATWRLSNGTLRPATLTDQLNGQAFQQTDSEIFRLHSGAPIPGADLAYVRLRFSSETVDVLASADNENWTTLASFSRADFPDSPALLRLGKIDARTGRPIDYYLPGDYGECRLDDFLVESASGAVLVEDHFEELSSAWTPNLSGQFGVSVFSSNGWLVVQGRANCRAFVERAVPAGAAQFSCRIQKYTDLGQTWAPALCLNWTDSKFVLVGYRARRALSPWAARAPATRLRRAFRRNLTSSLPA
jgi:hypothetical protein